MKTLCENTILEKIHKYFPNNSHELILGRGDDCAVLSLKNTQEKKLVLTTDIFVEDVHFRSSYFSPEAIGYKALAANISDIYAMGAEVLTAQLALCLPKNIDEDFLDSLLSSLASLAKEHNFTLSGGDLSKADKLSLSITLLGLVENEVNLYRNNSKISDIIYLIGEIGLSRLALQILENKADYEISHFPSAYKQHLFPQMYKEESMQIKDFALKYKEENFSLMDVSDGLAQDLPRLIQNNGYHLIIDKNSLHKELQLFAEKEGYSEREVLEFAIKGGEDYALLGTCPAHLWQEFQQNCPKARNIGFVIADKKALLNNQVLSIQGFDHFTV